MERSTVEALIRQTVADAEIQLEGADCNFTATIVSPQFEGVKPVARQQQLLAAFTSVLQSGELHALSLKAFTPAEWEKVQQSTPPVIKVEGLTTIQ